MTEETNIEKKQTTDDEIDLIEVAMKIWAERRLILKVVVVFFVLGLIVAFGSKKEYKSELTIISESVGSSTSGMFQQLSNLAGINISNNDKNPLSNPVLFPKIVESTPFLMELNHEEIYFVGLDKRLSLYDYFLKNDRKPIIKYIKEYTIGLPKKIFKKNKNNRAKEKNNTIKEASFELPTQAEKYVNSLIKSRINVNLEETGIIRISAEMPDPEAAFELVNKVKENLTNYLIEYKLFKARENLEFTKKQFKDAEKEFKQAQVALANFRDQNKNIVSSKVKNEEERLQSEYNVKFNVYNQLATRLEQAKIVVQEETPVFKVINTPEIPNNNYKPKVSVTIILSVFLGVFVSLFYLISKMIFLKIRQNVQTKLKNETPK